MRLFGGIIATLAAVLSSTSFNRIAMSQYAIDPEAKRHHDEALRKAVANIVDIRAEAIGTQVLPFQSARFRLTVRAKTDRALLAFYDPFRQPYIRYVDPVNRLVSGLGGDDPSMNLQDIAPRSYGRAVASSVGGLRTLPEAIHLHETVLSITFPLGAEKVRNRDSGHSDYRSFFESVGPKHFHITIAPLVEPPADAERLPTIVVRVKKPEDAADLAALQALQNDVDVLRSVNDPAIPVDANCLRKLRTLVHQYPESSYADYWRLTIASSLIGAGSQLIFTPKQRQEEIDRTYHSLRNYLGKSLNWWNSEYHPNRSLDEINGWIDEVERTAPAPDDVCRALAERRLELRFASLDDRNEALRYLQQIRNPRFAHMPTALIFRRYIHEIDDRTQETETARGLDAEWYDSFEWLRELDFFWRRGPLVNNDTFQAKWDEYRTRKRVTH